MGILPISVALLLIIQAHSAVPKQDAKPRTTMLSTFATKSGFSCTASVEEAGSAETGRNDKLKIRCDDATTMTYDFPLAAVYGLTVTQDGSGRIEVDWERGAGAAITIFQVQTVAGKTNAKKVFDHIAAGGGESFEGMNVVLANVGRRFLGNEVLPAATNVYRWQDGKYVFVAGYVWNPNAKQNDRYCVLLPSPICPAVTKTKAVPEDD